jgi:hypothetical protein
VDEAQTWVRGRPVAAVWLSPSAHALPPQPSAMVDTASTCAVIDSSDPPRRRARITSRSPLSFRSWMAAAGTLRSCPVWNPVLHGSGASSRAMAFTSSSRMNFAACAFMEIPPRVKMNVIHMRAGIEKE